MRRVHLVVTSAFLATGSLAVLPAPAQVASSAVPASSGAPVPGALATISDALPDTMAASKSPRHLLRHGIDYMEYGEYGRALSFLRQAESRSAELTGAERQQLAQAIEKAQKGLSDPETARPAIVSRTKRRNAGAIALATPPTTGRMQAIADPAVQTASATVEVEPAPPGVAPLAPMPTRPATLPIPDDPTPPAELASIGEAPTAPPVRPQVTPAAPPSAPAAIPLDPAVAPVGSSTPSESAEPVEVAPLPSAAPVLTLETDAAEEPAAAEATPAAEAAPVEAPSAEALPAELPAVDPAQVPAEVPAEAPAESTELPQLPLPAEEAPLPAEAPPVEPAPAAEAAPTEEPAPVETETLPPLPAEADAPQASLPPLPAGETEAEAPAPAPASALPPLPGEAPAPVQADLPADANDLPARVVGSAPKITSRLPSDLRAEVERLARRQENPTIRPSEDAVTDLRGIDVEDEIAASSNSLPRAPSPTEARPIRAIPVPEETVPIGPRQWGGRAKYWAAAATCHGTLYFQDPVLERYGQSMESKFGHAGRFLSYPLDDPTQSDQRNQIIQPLFSLGLFAAQVVTFPYKVVVDPPTEAEYDLGYFRPGDAIPPDTYYVPKHGNGPPLRGRFY